MPRVWPTRSSRHCDPGATPAEGGRRSERVERDLHRCDPAADDEHTSAGQHRGRPPWQAYAEELTVGAARLQQQAGAQPEQRRAGTTEAPRQIIGAGRRHEDTRAGVGPRHPGEQVGEHSARGQVVELFEIVHDDGEPSPAR